MNKIKMILLDAGHGGLINGKYVTPGKRSPKWDDDSIYYEGVGNRLIRDELAKMLDEANIKYEYVNFGDEDILLTDRVKKANRIVDEYGVNNTLYISIHSNAFTEERAKGWSVFTYTNTKISDIYGRSLFDEMKKIFPDEVFRKQVSNRKTWKADFYVLKYTKCAAILSENFFHSNEDECRRILMTEEGRYKIALAHFNMIKQFVKNDENDEEE